MVASTSRLSFEDCFLAFEAALADPRGVRLPFPDMDAATAYRFRLHAARRIAREENQSIYAPTHPLHGRSEYDPLVCRIRQEGPTHFIYIERMAQPVEIQPLSEIDNA